jgi:hypothetical protein
MGAVICVRQLHIHFYFKGINVLLGVVDKI